MTFHQQSRRDFMKTATGGAVAGAAALAGPSSAAAAPAQTAIPRWRGFNLLNFFQARFEGDRSSGIIPEDDFRWIADWGFDYVRVPMDYWLWIDTDYRQTGRMNRDDVYKIKESMLENVDRTVDLGKKYGLHVTLNFHRAPGYCINGRELEPFNLWQDDDALDAFLFHWDLFARRYSGTTPDAVSFNLFNEAPNPNSGFMSRDDYVRVVRTATAKIRESAPDHTIIIDGLSVGNVTVPELADLGVVQSVHAYSPARISHYRASWVDGDERFPEPAWPSIVSGQETWDRTRLEAHYAPWAELARMGVGVHCGEAGCYSRTPHPVFLAWLNDVMDILTGHGIGWALWEFRGSFGVLDSGRADVIYEDFHGHKLDRKLLSLLQKY